MNLSHSELLSLECRVEMRRLTPPAPGAFEDVAFRMYLYHRERRREANHRRYWANRVEVLRRARDNQTRRNVEAPEVQRSIRQGKARRWIDKLREDKARHEAQKRKWRDRRRAARLIARLARRRALIEQRWELMRGPVLR